MIWKLLLFLVGMILLIAFAWVNYDNVSDISFGFYNFNEIPVFISLFVSFIAGSLFSIPFAFFGRKKSPPREKLIKNPTDENYFDTDNGAKEKKKLSRPGFMKRKEKVVPQEQLVEPLVQESVFDSDKN